MWPLLTSSYTFDCQGDITKYRGQLQTCFSLRDKISYGNHMRWKLERKQAYGKNNITENKYHISPDILTCFIDDDKVRYSKADDL